MITRFSRPLKRSARHRRKTLFLPTICAVLLSIGVFNPVALAQTSDSVSLNFKDVDIRAVIDFVAQETGKNFIVDPRVKGQVTMVSGKPIARDKIYDIFLSMLRVHDFAAVEGRDVIKILPDVLAKQADLPPLPVESSGTSDDAYVTDVIPLDRVQAPQLVPILRPLVPQGGLLAASAEGNALLISDTAANVRRIREIARRIDWSQRDQVELIALQYAPADEVEAMLQRLRGNADKPGEASVVADARSNSLLLSGDREERANLKELIAKLDVPVETGNTKVIYLKHGDATEVAEVLQDMLDGNAAEGGEGGRQRAPSIKAHESTNSLVIRGSSQLITELEDIIPMLDTRRAQVLIEAVIAEVSDDVVAELGVQWAVGAPDSGFGLINFSRDGSGIVQIASGINNYLNGSTSTPPSLGSGAFLGSAARSGDTVIGALVRALSSNASNNILSTPTLLTMDNEEAEIIVGQNVPFISGRAIEDSGQAFDSIERQDIGVKLRVKPKINEGEAVQLAIEQEVSQIAKGAKSQDEAADIITNKRSLKTNVLVDDGQLVVLGGLIQDEVIQTRDKVPGLGDIPGLGALFRYDAATKTKRNLMIFLHPVVVRDRAGQRAITDHRYQTMRGHQLRSREQSVRNLPDDAVPVMPEIEQLLRLPQSFDEWQQEQAPAVIPSGRDAAKPSAAPSSVETVFDID